LAAASSAFGTTPQSSITIFDAALPLLEPANSIYLKIFSPSIISPKTQ
jgi:hypothetical protein